MKFRETKTAIFTLAVAWFVPGGFVDWCGANCAKENNNSDFHRECVWPAIHSTIISSPFYITSQEYKSIAKYLKLPYAIDPEAGTF
ncbi:MAG: hypothetical protein JSV82_08000 [Planctomycetota bacterium]|nr:MAG: hypothetical protein JSV82_08000 [Planctomycetota bacterium]